MSYINIKDEWKLLILWILAVSFILIFSDCTSAPNGAINIPYKPLPIYSIIEPLSTIHRYRTKPIIINNERLELYCLVHAYPEVIIKLRTSEWRVRRWKR